MVQKSNFFLRCRAGLSRRIANENRGHLYKGSSPVFVFLITEQRIHFRNSLRCEEGVAGQRSDTFDSALIYLLHFPKLRQHHQKHCDHTGSAADDIGDGLRHKHAVGSEAEDARAVELSFTHQLCGSADTFSFL